MEGGIFGGNYLGHLTFLLGHSTVFKNAEIGIFGYK